MSKKRTVRSRQHNRQTGNEMTSETESVENANPDSSEAQDMPAGTDLPDSESEPEEVTTQELYGLPSHWSASEVAMWEEKEIDPDSALLDAGVWRYDPTRRQRPATQWSDTELFHWLMGHLKGVGDDARKRELLDQIRQNTTHIDPHWTDQAVIDYFRLEISPKKTQSGVLVHDRLRPSKSAQDWSKEELDSWARGEIEATEKASVVHLARALKEAYHLKPKGQQATDIIQAYFEAIDPPQDIQIADHWRLPPMQHNFIEQTLEHYVEAVKPRTRITQQQGEKAQRELERVFQYVLKLEGEDMLKGLETIKVTVKRHRNGVFSPDYAYRFVQSVGNNPRAVNNHINLIELFLLVTDENQARRRQMDFHHMLRHFPQDQQQRLMDYFTNYA